MTTSQFNPATAQTFTVPAGVTSVFLEAFGGNYGGYGGGHASGTLAVTPGQTLYISFPMGTVSYATVWSTASGSGNLLYGGSVNEYYDDWDETYYYSPGSGSTYSPITGGAVSSGTSASGAKALVTYTVSGYTAVAATRATTWNVAELAGLFHKVGNTGLSTLNGAPAYSQSPTAGNLLIMGVVAANNVNNSTCATPAGWTAGPTGVGGTGPGYNARIFTFWKIAAGGDAPPVVSVTNSGWSYGSVVEEWAVSTGVEGLDAVSTALGSLGGYTTAGRTAPFSAVTTTRNYDLVWSFVGAMSQGLHSREWGGGSNASGGGYLGTYIEIAVGSNTGSQIGSVTPTLSWSGSDYLYSDATVSLAFKTNDGLSSVSATRATTWNVSTSQTPVSASRSTTWNVAAQVAPHFMSTAWDVASNIASVVVNILTTQDWVVPAGVTSLRLFLEAAEGGGGSYWNNGGAVAATYACTAGETLGWYLCGQGGDSGLTSYVYIAGKGYIIQASTGWDDGFEGDTGGGWGSAYVTNVVTGLAVGTVSIGSISYTVAPSTAPVSATRGTTWDVQETAVASFIGWGIPI